MSETVVELKPAAPALSLPREIAPEDWARDRGKMAEILAALGLPLVTRGTRDTP